MNHTNNIAVLTAFERAVLDEIRAISDAKEAAGMSPINVLAFEMKERLNAAMNRLYTLRLIEVGSTLNDKWIKLVRTDAENE